MSVRNNYSRDEADVADLNMNQISRLASYLKPYKSQVTLTVILMFIATFAELISPYLLQIAVDEYIPRQNLPGLLAISVLYLIAIGLNYVCTRSKELTANKVGHHALLDLRSDLFNHVQSLSFSFFGQNSAGKIIVRIVNDVNTLNNLFTNGIVRVLTELAMLIVAALMMFIIHTQLALATFAAVPLFMVGIFVTRNVIKRNWRVVRKKLSNLNAYLHENIVGMRVIQAYVRQKENKRIFHGVLDDVFASWMKAIRLNSAFVPSVELISVIGTITIYWYGARLLEIEGITVGVVIAFTVYLQRFWQPVIMLSNFYNQLLVAMASSERIFELMDQEQEVTDSPRAKHLTKAEGAVEFDHVTFAYEQKTVLHDVSFQVKPGETTALVGPTGSGKTTIISLLARFYDPKQGRVLIDGQDIRHISLNSLRDRIGIMLQDPFLFSGTIMDNIRYGRPDATDEEVIAVAKAVYAHPFIIEMEHGYYTEVNERGSRLSIGQRQLICFARVLLTDPDILILDEATASVDTHTEVLLQRAIEKLLKNRTSFVIAHRLSTIRHADQIMVIDKGTIAEMGTHQQLMNSKGMYYHLYKVQYEYLKAI